MFNKSIICLLMISISLSFAEYSDSAPKNVILVIGDGMGKMQESATEMYLGRKLSWTDAPYQTSVKTESTKSITDSAASATAIATGVRVNNGVISVYLPGNKSSILTSLEYYQHLQNKRTAIITNTEILHATPAAFASHQRDRSEYQKIWEDYLNSKPNIIMGGGRKEVNLNQAEQIGYKTATTKTEMNQFQPTDEFVMGIFGNDHLPYMYGNEERYRRNDFPYLHEMLIKTLDLLNENNENGFFLMVECGRIDHAGHSNNITRLIHETIECDLMFQYIKEYTINNQNETLTIVTADHETGGLTIDNNRGIGRIPDVSWSTGGHSKANVNLYAYGNWASWIESKNQMENQKIFDLSYFGEKEDIDFILSANFEVNSSNSLYINSFFIFILLICILIL